MAPRTPEELIAEEIVRNHTGRCDGELDDVSPWCSCAPDGTPLCNACQTLADSIAAALTEAKAELAESRQESAARKVQIEALEQDVMLLSGQFTEAQERGRR